MRIWSKSLFCKWKRFTCSCEIVLINQQGAFGHVKHGETSFGFLEIFPASCNSRRLEKANSCIFLIWGSQVRILSGTPKECRNLLYLLYLFLFGTKRGIAPIAQVFFWGCIRKQASANSFRSPTALFPLRDLRAERPEKAPTRSLLTKSGPPRNRSPDLG